MLKVSELRKKNTEDLKEELIKVQDELRKMVPEILQRKEKNVRKVGLMRKDIARIKTLMNEKFKEGQK